MTAVRLASGQSFQIITVNGCFCGVVFINAAVQFIKAEVCMTCPAKSIKDVYKVAVCFIG